MLLLLPVTGIAQNTGYMGRKLSLGISGLANTNGVFAEDIVWSFYYKTALEADYSFARQASLGLKYVFNKAPAECYSQEYGASGYYKSDNPTVKANMKLIALTLKLFRKNALAPLGTYMNIDLGYLGYQTIDDKGITYQKGRKLAKGNSLYIGAGIGRQSLIFNNLLLDVGVSMGVAPKTFALYSDRGTYYDPSGTGTYRDVDVYYRESVFANYLLNAQLGLHYLLH